MTSPDIPEPFRLDTTPDGQPVAAAGDPPTPALRVSIILLTVHTGPAEQMSKKSFGLMTGSAVGRVSATKKLRQTGNTLSLNFDPAIRDAAGFAPDQELLIEAEAGRIVVTAAGDRDFFDALAAYEESLARYRAVYDALAR